MRIRYISRPGRLRRVEEGARHPDDHFYGYWQLAATEGLEVDLIERPASSAIGAWTQTQIHRFTQFSPDFKSYWDFHPRHLEGIDFVVSNSMPSLYMIALRRRRRSPRLVSIVMGIDKILDRSRFPGLTRRQLRWYFDHIDLTVAIGEGELDYLLQNRLAPAQRVHLIPFGVDTSFWTPPVEDDRRDLDPILAVGNDDGRDYSTLIQAIGTRRLRLHTNRPLPEAPLPDTITVTSGDWNEARLSDEDLRELYRRTPLVITPLKPSHQPQGQSVTLQAMACGACVVLTRTAGLWSRELMVDDVNCVLVDPGNVKGLASTIDALMKDPGRRARIGARARASVETHFSSDRFARTLLEAIRMEAMRVEANRVESKRGEKNQTAP